MTEPFASLLALQGHDTTIDQLRHRARTLPERAALREARARLDERRTALSAVTKEVDELSGGQRVLEEQIAAASTRRHELERRMRSGGYSVRDLQAMDHEINHLAGRQAGLEEQELALLEEQEPLDAALAEHRTTVDELAEEADRLESSIADQESSIERDIERQQAERSQLAVRVPADLLARYEAVRERRGGVGAAALVGDHCDGCHLTLPAVDLDRIRRLPPDEVVVCPECDRILVR